MAAMLPQMTANQTLMAHSLQLALTSSPGEATTLTTSSCVVTSCTAAIDRLRDAYLLEGVPSWHLIESGFGPITARTSPRRPTRSSTPRSKIRYVSAGNGVAGALWGLGTRVLLYQALRRLQWNDFVVLAVQDQRWAINLQRTEAESPRQVARCSTGMGKVSHTLREGYGRCFVASSTKPQCTSRGTLVQSGSAKLPFRSHSSKASLPTM
eukprot:3789254-Rhodomonas_salina.1